ncbi:MAG TPA: glycosyltransferase family 4 protein [Ornithinibacter sp.]|nr:glycosyltransferase family 4 protein [Ornithinibacter sp.]
MSRTVRLVTRLFAPEVGAAAFRQRALAESFADLGYDVDVVTTTPPESVRAVGPLDDGPLRVSRWPVLRDANGNVRGYLHYLTFDVPALFRLLARRPPILLVAEPPPTTGVVVRVVAALQRRPYVYYAADIWSDGAASAGAPRVVVAVLRRVETWVVRRAALVLSVSEGVTERLELLGVPRERVFLVGNGVDTEVFRPEGPRAAVEGPYFAYAGTMSEWQGADVFVEALARVRSDHPRARIVFMGQGSEQSALRELASVRVPGAVEFRGVVPPAEAASIMRGAAAGLVSIKPGLGYDFAKPTKIYAATGCGTPVVFAGVGAGRELVVGHGLGWAPGYDVEAVAEAMCRALDQPDPGDASVRLSAWTEEHASLRAAARAAAVAALEATGST